MIGSASVHEPVASYLQVGTCSGSSPATMQGGLISCVGHKPGSGIFKACSSRASVLGFKQAFLAFSAIESPGFRARFIISRSPL